MNTTLKEQVTAIAGVYKITQPNKSTIDLLVNILDTVDYLIGEAEGKGVTEDFEAEYSVALSKLLYVGSLQGFDLEQMLGKILLQEINSYKKVNKL